MDQLDFSLFTLGGSLLAGLLGALTGLGGGVVIVPMLVLLFKVDLHYAIGASLVSVIATSSGAAAAYVREGFSNIRIGMFLEIATTAGRGWRCACWPLEIPPAASAIVFGLVLLYSAWHLVPRSTTMLSRADEPAARWRALAAERHLSHRPRARTGICTSADVTAGFGLMFVRRRPFRPARASAPARSRCWPWTSAMRMPFKVSTTTSNFMIGVTAAASAGIYLQPRLHRSRLAMPVMLGVLAGLPDRRQVAGQVARQNAAPDFRRCDRGPGRRNDLQRLGRKGLICAD